MKLVFTDVEVALALRLTTDEFAARRHLLEAHGFPAPIEGLFDRWSIIDVVNWVNRDKAHRSEHGEGMAEGPDFSDPSYSNVTPFRKIQSV